MPVINATEPVGSLVAERPARAEVFESFGIDYCCGGAIPLEAACSRKGVNLDEVLSALSARDAAPAEYETDWTAASLTELADHIEQTHHLYLRRELPRLEGLIDKVVNAHADHHPHLREVQRVFAGLQEELVSHMHKEEAILFPWCRRLETGEASGMSFSVRNPIFVMEAEHEAAGNALAELRRLTRDFAVPADACNTYRVMLDTLAELERDLHIHIHKENNILFPRAVELEQSGSK